MNTEKRIFPKHAALRQTSAIIFNLTVLLSINFLLTSLWIYIGGHFDSLNHFFTFLTQKLVFKFNSFNIPIIISMVIVGHICQIISYSLYLNFNMHRVSQIQMFSAIMIAPVIISLLGYYYITSHFPIASPSVGIYKILGYAFIINMWFTITQWFIIVNYPLIDILRLEFSTHRSNPHFKGTDLSTALCIILIQLYYSFTQKEINHLTIFQTHILPSIFLIFGIVIMNMRATSQKESFLNENFLEIEDTLDNIVDNVDFFDVHINNTDPIALELNALFPKFKELFKFQKEHLKKVEVLYHELSVCHDKIQENIDAQIENMEPLQTSIERIQNGIKSLIERFTSQYDEMITKISDLENTSNEGPELVRMLLELRNQSIIDFEAVSAVQKKFNESKNLSRNISNIIQDVGEEIRSASKETSHIDEILLLVQDIAEQTNVLSINAALEAAHAGESGKGFALISNEVRSLATISSEAVKKISEKLIRVQDIIQEALEFTNEAEQISLQNNVLVDNGVAAIDSITTGTEQLKHGIKESYAISEKQNEKISQTITLLSSLKIFISDLNLHLEHNKKAFSELSIIADTLPEYIEALGAFSNSFNEAFHILEKNHQEFIEIFALKNPPLSE